MQWNNIMRGFKSLRITARTHLVFTNAIEQVTIIKPQLYGCVTGLRPDGKAKVCSHTLGLRVLGFIAAYWLAGSNAHKNGTNYSATINFLSLHVVAAYQ